MRSVPDPSSAAAIVDKGLSALSGDVAENLGAVAAAGAGGPLASLCLSVMITGSVGVLQSKSDELARGLNAQFTDFAEQLDEDDPRQAKLMRAVDSVSRLLPKSNELEKSVAQAVSGDPKRLANLLDQYASDPEMRRSMDASVEKILSGELDELTEGEEYDDFIDYFQDSFDTETRDDAIQAFLDVRKLFVSEKVREVLENTAQLNLAATDIQDRIERTEETLDTRFTAILEANLKDEGFVRLSPYYFEQNDAGDPVTSWRTGFSLAAVHDGYAIERTEPQKEGGQRCWKALMEALKEGEDHVVLGRPGTGKSTLCKGVACHWYDQRLGTVFYRESGPKRFGRTGVLEECIRDAEGNVLVVVEDVARENANDILQILLEFKNDPAVSFLLDSRIEEWKSLTRELTNPRILNQKQELTQYHVPDFEEIECARALRKFKNTTGHAVRESPEELLEAIETDHGVGEMYLLGHRLSSFDFDQPNTLLADVRSLYHDIVTGGKKLDQQVALTINILNASGNDIYPEILHGLADGEGEHEQVEEIVDEFAGRLLFEMDGRHQSHHPYWSRQYLSFAQDQSENSTIRLFESCLNAIFRLFDDSDRREEVRDWYRNEPELVYFDEIEEEPQITADSIVQDIFEIGKRHPSLAPLFNTSDQSNIRIPSVCSPEIHLDCTMWRGEMYLENGKLEKAESEFRSLLEEASEIDVVSEEKTKLVVGGANLNLGELFRRHGKLDQARERLEESIDVFDSLDNDRWKARAYAEFGVVERRSGNLNDADEKYEQSIALCRGVNYRFGEAKALNNRGMVKKDRGNLESAKSDVERALQMKKDGGHSPSSIAISQNTLGEIYYQWGKLDEAEWYFNRSLREKKRVGHRSGIAWSKYYLGLVAEERGEFDEAQKLLSDSLETRREVNDRLGQGRCLNALGELSIEFGKLNEAKNYLDESQEKLENVGDSMGRARNYLHRGTIKLERGELAEAESQFANAIDIFGEIDNNRGLARAFLSRARIEKRLTNYTEAKENLECAQAELEDLSAVRYEKPVVEELIEVCEKANLPAEALKWEDRYRDLNE